MSIPALVAGLIKYGERTWVLCSVSRDKSGKIVPLGYVESEDLNLGNNNTLGDIIRVHIAQKCVQQFWKYTEYYDIENNKFKLEKPLNLDIDNKLLWEAIEVEMGLVFDVLYTKAPINFTKDGWILRCITFSCTMAVLIGLILQLTSTRQKRLKVDIAITVMLLVGALAMEIYATISLYLFSDWAIFWLNKHNIFRGKRVILLRKKFSWLFLPERYRCRAIAQYNVLDYFLDHVEPGLKVPRRRLRSLLGYLKDMLKLNPSKTAAIKPSDMCNPILSCRDYLHKPLPQLRIPFHFNPEPEEDSFWIEFFQQHLYSQILRLHPATEVCYHLEDRWAVGSEINHAKTAEDDRELCIKLSRYMMYLVVKQPSLLPMNVSDNAVWDIIGHVKEHLKKEPSQSMSVEEPSQSMSVAEARACEQLLEADASSEFKINDIVTHVRETPKERRWDMLKWVWVRTLCYAATEGQRNEHFRQLSQGGEFITFLWFFLPQSTVLLEPRSS